MYCIESTKAMQLEKFYIYLGIPIVVFIGTLMHFVYDWSGQLTIVGIFAPVNESIWEHLKLAFFPLLFWWLLTYFIIIKEKKISVTQWLFSCVTALLTSSIFIMSFYYTYTGAFGIHSLFLDILSFILGVAVAQILAYHIYQYAKLTPLLAVSSIILLFLLIIAFIIFTFEPPEIPLFQDPLTGSYGI